MRSFFDLVGFEYKKIFIQKGAIIALIITTLVSLVSPALILIGNVYVNGKPVESKYDAMVKDREYARVLSGLNIDEILLSEVKDAYAKIPLVERYTITPEYEQYGRPYDKIFWIMYDVYKLKLQSWKNLTLDEMQNFSQIRHEAVAKQINDENMSKKSKEKMIQLDSKIASPFVFSYTDGYDRFISLMVTTGLFAAYAIAICIAPMFAGEYGMHTDQLILSSKLGKNKLISAKLFTSVSFCIIICLLFSVCTYLMCGFLFGFDGADAPFQLAWTLNPYPFSMAQASVIYSVCITFIAILMSGITLLLSSKFKSPFGVIIIISVMLFAPLMFSVSSDNILIYNLFNLFPSNMMYSWGVFSYIPYEFFGLSAIPYVFIPIFSALVSAVTLPLAWHAFKNHQIG